MEILYRIINEKNNRELLIKEFQENIWDTDPNLNDIEYELLSTLAYDLDFYEPNEIFRNEDSSYFGDEKLEELINEALEKISYLQNENFF